MLFQHRFTPPFEKFPSPIGYRTSSISLTLLTYFMDIIFCTANGSPKCLRNDGINLHTATRCHIPEDSHLHCQSRDQNKSGTYFCQTNSTAPNKMDRECRTHKEHEDRVTLYWENKTEEVPGIPNGNLADNSKMHVPEYASQEVQRRERFRIIESCRNLHGAFIFPDRIFKLSGKTQSCNKFSLSSKTLLVHCC